MVTAIDRKDSPYHRPSFTSSIAGKIERLAKNGEHELVERAIAWLSEHNLDSGKPVFTRRHRIWALAAQAKEAEATIEARAEKESELLAEASGIELWADYRADRAQLIFPDKPGHATREQLKRSGWRWSPTNGAWQRQLTNAALESGKSVLAGLQPPPEHSAEHFRNP